MSGRWAVSVGGTKAAKQRWPRRTYATKAAARRRVQQIHEARDMGVATIAIVPVSSHGNTVIRRGTPVRVVPTRRALLWLPENGHSVATTLDGRRYIIYREGRMFIAAVKTSPLAQTRDIGIYSSAHEAKSAAQNHLSHASRAKTRPSSRSNVARGMIAAGTGRAQKFRHKNDRRAKERERAWRHEDHGDRKMGHYLVVVYTPYARAIIGSHKTKTAALAQARERRAYYKRLGKRDSAFRGRNISVVIEPYKPK